MSAVLDAPPQRKQTGASALYRGTVRHLRSAPKRHAFTRPLFVLYLDVDELLAVLDRLPLAAHERRALISFRRADYLGPHDVPLREAVLDRIETATGLRPRGPVRMLTHLRFAGHVFNPVTFYYAFAEDGEQLEAVVAEITNTPWKERHAYVLATRDAAREGDTFRWSFDKAFHVSPFHAMEQRYTWRFTVPGEHLRVHMTNAEHDHAVFEAELTLERTPLTARSFLAALLRFPLMSLQVVAAIHLHALLLWLKRVPFHVHPARRLS